MSHTMNYRIVSIMSGSNVSSCFDVVGRLDSLMEDYTDIAKGGVGDCLCHILLCYHVRCIVQHRVVGSPESDKSITALPPQKRLPMIDLRVVSRCWKTVG